MIANKATGFFVAAAMLGCAPNSPSDAQVDEALSSYVLDRAPAEIEHPRFIDFGGKVRLLGYDGGPTGEARPGEPIKIKMYWAVADSLRPGWRLFTHLLNEYGAQIDNFDNRGPLRELKGDDQALPPSRWERGKVYVDEQEIRVPNPDPNLPWPKNVTTTVTLVTGVWKGGTRLRVLSGPRDGENSGIVAHFQTGLVRPRPGGDEAATAKSFEGQ